MSMALQDVTPIMKLLGELKLCKFKVICTESCMYCKVFEDNSGTLKLAKVPKVQLYTEHIDVCHHHFCEHIRKEIINIFPVSRHKRTNSWHFYQATISKFLYVTGNSPADSNNHRHKKYWEGMWDYGQDWSLTHSDCSQNLNFDQDFWSFLISQEYSI